ncbi:MAG: L-serine ammonia-lyase, iron-sulfur-dependent, subunit alpha [Alistipes finegoldii]
MAAARPASCSAAPAQIEYAAEMGLEHHLGLTCDPSADLCRSPASNATIARPEPSTPAPTPRSPTVRMVSFDKVVGDERNRPACRVSTRNIDGRSPNVTTTKITRTGSPRQEPAVTRAGFIRSRQPPGVIV